MEHRIISRQNNILSYCKFDAIEYFTRIACIAAQIKSPNNFFGIFATVTGIHNCITERSSVIEDAVRLGEEHQIFRQFCSYIKGLSLICGGQVAIHIVRRNLCAPAFAIVENKNAAVHHIHVIDPDIVCTLQQ